ncbi:hypothetical protein, partial [Corynebacterium amycolatum]
AGRTANKTFIIVHRFRPSICAYVANEVAVATSLLRLGFKATKDVGAHGMTKSALPVVEFCVVGCQGETNTVANVCQDVVDKAREFDRESADL